VNLTLWPSMTEVFKVTLVCPILVFFFFFFFLIAPRSAVYMRHVLSRIISRLPSEHPLTDLGLANYILRSTTSNAKGENI